MKKYLSNIKDIKLAFKYLNSFFFKKAAKNNSKPYPDTLCCTLGAYQGQDSSVQLRHSTSDIPIPD